MDPDNESGWDAGEREAFDAWQALLASDPDWAVWLDSIDQRTEEDYVNRDSH